MSDEKFKKIIAEPAVTPNPSSIMSAPVDKKKAERFVIVVLILAVSLALNIILAVVSFSKNERINQLQKDAEDNEALIIELKNKINSLDSFDLR